MTRIKTFALAAVAAATLMAAAAPSAEARGFRQGGGVGIGGLVAGLIIGGAAAAIASRAHAEPSYGRSYATPSYVAPVRDCYVTRQWVDTAYGAERRTVRVCN